MTTSLSIGDLSNLVAIRRMAEENCERVAKLGDWPAYIEPQSILSRIPRPDAPGAGFDAGLACALGLIPLDQQKVSAGLHAAYTPNLVSILRQYHQTLGMGGAGRPWDDSYGTQVTWWLAACAVCREEDLDEATFLQQVREFSVLITHKRTREIAAVQELKRMLSLFNVTHSPGVKHAYASGHVDGCIQGAYLAGHNYGLHVHAGYGVTFIGTFRESLGLEDFEWSDEVDDQGRAMSGPVFGSRQFVKCATSNQKQANEALQVVQEHLGCRPSMACKGC